MNTFTKLGMLRHILLFGVSLFGCALTAIGLLLTVPIWLPAFLAWAASSHE